MAAEPTITNICTSWVFQGAAGGAVGVGIMILLLAKWGKKIFGGDALLVGPQGAQGIPGVPGTLSPCPFAGDHPTLQAFMGESLADRQDMRKFLEDINGKVNTMNSGVSKMEGKLDLLLQGARVRWNSNLIPPDREGGK